MCICVCVCTAVYMYVCKCVFELEWDSRIVLLFHSSYNRHCSVLWTLLYNSGFRTVVFYFTEQKNLSFIHSQKLRFYSVLHWAVKALVGPFLFSYYLNSVLTVGLCYSFPNIVTSFSWAFFLRIILGEEAFSTGTHVLQSWHIWSRPLEGHGRDCTAVSGWGMASVSAVR